MHSHVQLLLNLSLFLHALLPVLYIFVCLFICFSNQREDLTFMTNEYYSIEFDPSFKLVDINFSKVSEWLSYFGIICKLDRSSIICRYIKWCWTKNKILGTCLETFSWQLFWLFNHLQICHSTVLSTPHLSLLSTEYFERLCHAFTKTMFYYFYSISMIYQTGHFVIEKRYSFVGLIISDN